MAHIDPNQMTTPVGRELAAKLNQKNAATDVRLQRLSIVLKEYAVFKRELQLDLAEAAIIWTTTVMAGHPRRKDSESYFFAIVDLMYASSFAAEELLCESDRQQIDVTAEAVTGALLPSFQENLRESMQLLAGLKADHVFRELAKYLQQTRVKFLEHAALPDVVDLICKCFMFWAVHESFQVGMNTENELGQAVSNLTGSLATLQKGVVNAIKSGKLKLQDGRIVEAYAAS